MDRTIRPTEHDIEAYHNYREQVKVINPTQHKQHLISLLINKIRGMFSVRPIIGNIIALMLAGFVLYYIYHQVDASWFTKYQHYFAIAIMIFAAIQVIRSGANSLILPFLAMVMGGVISHSLGQHQLLFTFGKSFYTYMMVVGIIGLGIAVLSIE